MIDHLIFDFDGTISDSYPVFVRIFHEIGEAHGWEFPFDDVAMNRSLRINVYQCFKDLGWEEHCDINKFLDEFHELQAAHTLDFEVFPEMVELLEYSVKMGKKNYIYTHSGDVVHQMMRNMKIDHLFTFVLDSSYGFPKKPAPDALLFFLQKFHLDAKSCMMIGDRPIDADAGMNAGMYGCLWDADQYYPDAKADYKVTELLQIKELLK